MCYAEQMGIKKTMKQRFWDRLIIKDNGCWEWPAYKDKDGYGILTTKIPKTRKNIIQKTHRLAYENVFGKIPDKQCVCHKCDNPSCCNPYHLFLGSSADNNKDARNKGRAILDKNRKFSKDLIQGMLNMHDSGDYTKTHLSRVFGISETHISRLIKTHR